MFIDICRRYHFVFLPLAMLAIICLYIPVLNFNYVWDDKLLILTDARMQSGDLTWSVISRPVLEKTTYFRPLVFLTYFFEIKFFGLNPGLAHLNNIIIFVLNLCLVYFLSGEIFKRLEVINLNWLVSILYVFHPVLVESNAWLAGRFDLMVTTFMFLSLWIYLKLQSSWIRDALLASCFLLGLASKEMAITLPALVFIVFLLCNPAESLWQGVVKFLKKNKRLIALYGLVTLFYFFLRYISVGGIYHLKEASEASNGYNFLYPLYTLTFYLHQILLPFFDINPQHNAIIELSKGYQNYFSYSVVTIFVVSLVIGSLRNKAWAWLGLLGLVSLSPVLNIIPMTIGGNIGHERFLATPLLFFITFFLYVACLLLRN